MSGGFGRKGLGPGDRHEPSSGGFGRAPQTPMPRSPAIPATRFAPIDPMEAKRQEFIASERARRAEEAGSPIVYEQYDPSGGGLSDIAQSYRSAYDRPQRSLAMAYILWFILGQLSAHRFYLGKTQSAIAQVCAFVSFVVLMIAGVHIAALIIMVGWMLWVLGDVFFIKRMHHEFCRPAAFGSPVSTVFS